MNRIILTFIISLYSVTCISQIIVTSKGNKEELKEIAINTALSFGYCVYTGLKDSVKTTVKEFKIDKDFSVLKQIIIHIRKDTFLVEGFSTIKKNGEDKELKKMEPGSNRYIDLFTGWNELYRISVSLRDKDIINK